MAWFGWGNWWRGFLIILVVGLVSGINQVINNVILMIISIVLSPIIIGATARKLYRGVEDNK